MFILAFDEQRRIARTGYIYLLVSLFCLLFGAVYEHFSHNVYSPYMIYAFVFPLACGALPFLSMALLGLRKLPGRRAIYVYNCGIATVTVGSIMEGVLAIYGTSSALLCWYWYVGLGLVITGTMLYIFSLLSPITGSRL